MRENIPMETSPDQRWAAQVAWMNATHELFVQGQLAQGRTWNGHKNGRL